MALSARPELLLAVLCSLFAHNAAAREFRAGTIVDATGPGTQTVYEQLAYAPAHTAPGMPPVAVGWSPEQRRDFEAAFEPYPGNVIPAGDFWFRFSLLAPGTRDNTRFLQIENPRIPLSEIWYLAGDTWRPLSLEGPEHGMGSHITRSPRVSVLLPVGREHLEVMVRLRDEKAFVPRMYVLDAPALRVDSLVSLFVGGLAFGMLLLLIAFNAVISMFTQDARYRTLSIYMAATFVFLLHYLGYGQVLFWSDWVDWDQQMIHAAGLFTFAAYIPFVLRMLSLETTWYARFYVTVMWVAGLAELTVGLGEMNSVLQIAGGLVSISMHPLAVYVALRGNRDGWLFIGATCFVFIGGTTTWAETLWGIGGGTAGHMLFLWGNAATSLALVILLARQIVSLRLKSLRSEDTARRAQANAHDARQEAQSKGAFLATMSHEIRTPLNGVLGMAELLAQSKLSGEQASQVGTILRSGQGLMAILNDILDYSKFESGQLVIEQEDCDLYVLLDDLALVWGERVREKNIRFELQVGPEVPEIVVTDPTRLRQVLENLLSNAAKFTEAGCIRLQVGTQGETLVVRVEDTGIGIRDEDAAGLFERFRQADSSITRQFGGTGLGLAICKLLCEAMGGNISLQTRFGHGSTFTVRIPCPTRRQFLGDPQLSHIALTGKDRERLRGVADLLSRWPVQVTADAATRYDVDDGIRLVELRRLCCLIDQDPLEETSTPLAGFRLLVAEDNLTNQLVARKTLTMFGAEVEIAGNGREALDRLAQGDFDLVLMDCDMPVMDGYSAAEAIRATEAREGRAAIPIVALTAHAGAEYRARAEACGMNAYLAKPLRQRTLLETILDVTRPVRSGVVGV